MPFLRFFDYCSARATSYPLQVTARSESDRGAGFTAGMSSAAAASDAPLGAHAAQGPAGTAAAAALPLAARQRVALLKMLVESRTALQAERRNKEWRALRMRWRRRVLQGGSNGVHHSKLEQVGGAGWDVVSSPPRVCILFCSHCAAFDSTEIWADGPSLLKPTTDMLTRLCPPPPSATWLFKPPCRASRPTCCSSGARPGRRYPTPPRPWAFRPGGSSPAPESTWPCWAWGGRACPGRSTPCTARASGMSCRGEEAPFSRRHLLLH